MANNLLETFTVSRASGFKSATSGTTFTISSFLDADGNPANPSLVDAIVISVGTPSATVSVSQMQDNLGNIYTRYDSVVSGALTLEMWICSLVTATGAI